MKTQSHASDELSPEAERRLQQILATDPAFNPEQPVGERIKGGVYVGLFCHCAAIGIIWALVQLIRVMARYPYGVPTEMEEEVRMRRDAVLPDVLHDVWITIGIYSALKVFHLFLRSSSPRFGTTGRTVIGVAFGIWLVAVIYGAERLATGHGPIVLLYCAIAAILMKGVYNVSKLAL